MLHHILLCKMFSITFSKGKCSAPTKCDAEHFPMENGCWIFSKGKCSAKQNVSNAFEATVLFCKQKTKAVQKCIWCCCVFCTAKNKGSAKIYLMQKCIFAKKRKNHILLCWTFSKGKCSATLFKNAFDAKIFLRTFSFGKCSASHFPLENVQLCKNAFDAKMHLMPKCIWCFAKIYLMQKCIWCKNAFWHTFSKGKCSAVQKCIFASHFPLENVQHHILLRAKMHFCKTKCYKCIWCKNAFLLCKNAFLHFIFQRKMWCIATFSKGKCSALQKCICAKMHLMRTFCNTKCYKCIWCKNAFDAKMHFGIHFPKENVQRTFSFGKCSAYIFQRKMFSCAKMHLMLHFVTQNVTNAFDAKMHLMPKCILAYIFQRKMFSIHFPKENVQLCKNAFDAKMHFCNASHFTK